MDRCSGHSKRTGEPCGRPPARGRTVCASHGGRSPRGIASPHWITGRYSKVLPARLVARYTDAQADHDLLALREEIALLDTRLAEVLQRLDSGESGAIWVALQAAYREYQKADAACKLAEREDAQAKLHDLIAQGLADYAVWSDVRTLIQERRALVESERKRMVEMQQYVTVERVLTLVSALTASVKRHVQDYGALRAISNDLEALLHGHPEVASVAG
jgi:hypothetical protein